MGLLQKVSVDSITNKISFLFRNSKSVIFDPSAVLPPGSVLAHAGVTAPQGFLLCDGTAVSRTTYGALFKAIGVAHGYGDTSTTFNIPDFRGRFLRGVDGIAGRDADKTARTAANPGGNTGNAVGSVQGNATAKNGLTNSSSSITFGALSRPGTHVHDMSDQSGPYGTNTASSWISTSITANTYPDRKTGANGDHTHTVGASSAAAQDMSSTDSETRPLNIYVNYIIKI